MTEQGIPVAFVVNREGRIVWIGQPMGGLEDVLDAVAAGKDSVEDVRKVEAEIKKQHEARMEREKQHESAKKNN